MDEKMKEADVELKAVIKTLQQSKNRRKRSASGDNKVSFITQPRNILLISLFFSSMAGVQVKQRRRRRKLPPILMEATSYIWTLLEPNLD